MCIRDRYTAQRKQRRLFKAQYQRWI